MVTLLVASHLREGHGLRAFSPLLAIGSRAVVVLVQVEISLAYSHVVEAADTVHLSVPGRLLEGTVDLLLVEVRNLVDASLNSSKIKLQRTSRGGLSSLRSLGGLLHLKMIFLFVLISDDWSLIVALVRS